MERETDIGPADEPIATGRDGDEPTPGSWPCLASVRGPDLRIFHVRRDELVNPRTGRSMERIVLEAPDWVNVLAVTARGRIVLVRQYRFGAREVTTEIPGGIVDPGETSRAAAERELREETGYVAERWSYLGSVQPNPAFLDNLCHHWLAEGARRVAKPQLEGGEDIQVIEVDLPELARMIERAEIRHSLVITAASRILDLSTHRREEPEGQG